MTGPQSTSGERDRLMSMLFGYFPPQAVYVATRIGLADHLARGPLPADKLAEATQCHPGALRRLLHALTTLGVLEQPRPDTFGLTGTGELLRADHPSSVRNYVLLFCGEQVWQSWGDLEYSVRTGNSAWERRYGPPFGDNFMAPQAAAIFNAAMAEGTARSAPAIVAAGGFGRFGTVADLGGGRGALLAAILTAHPGLRGILFDLPRALEGADGVLAAAGVADRCTVLPGSFFEAVPSGADAYLLKSVIHDWDDERAAAILATCRQAMPPGATLLLVEPVATDEPGRQNSFSVSYSDLNMLVCTSGRERTGPEFRRLLAAAGFAPGPVTPCPPGNYSILEATPQPSPGQPGTGEPGAGEPGAGQASTR
jgi:O-methyltransferase domain/Dimerisation domain